MCGDRSVRVEPHVARTEKQAGLADVEHRLLLLWTDPALDPEELAFAGEALEQAFFIEIGKDPRQFARRLRRVDHLRRLSIERMRRQVGSEDPTVPVRDVGARRNDLRARRGRARLDGIGGRERPHAQAHHGESAKECDAQDQQPALGALTCGVTRRLVAFGQVRAFDRVGVLARAAGSEDTGKRAERRAGHSEVPRAITSCTCSTAKGISSIRP